jgi:hypothetical protein
MTEESPPGHVGPGPGARRPWSARPDLPASGRPATPAYEQPPPHPRYGPPHGYQGVPPGTYGPVPGMYYPPPYGYPIVERRMNGLAIASFVLGLFCIAWIGSILAVIFGHVALGQISRSRDTGRGLAIAGLVLGYIGLVFLLFYIVLRVMIANPGSSSF